MPFAIEDFVGDQIEHDLAREIVFQGADEAVLLAGVLAQGVRPAVNTEVKWMGQGAQGYRTQINNGGSAYTGATTTIVVDSTANFRPGDILIAEATGEVVRVASITNGTTMVIVRGVGSTSGAAGSVADDAFLRSIGAAFGEGTDRATPRKQAPVEYANLTQIFKEGVEITGTAQAVSTRTEDEQARQRMLGMRRVVDQIVRSFYFGRKSSDLTDANGKPIRTMDGLYSAITTNVMDPSGALTEDWLWEALEPVFAVGSPRKMLYSGSVVVRQINSIFKDRVRITQGTTAVGMNVSVVLTPFGELQMVHDRALNGPYARDAVILDMENIAWRPLGDRDLELKADVQNPGSDTAAEEWLAEGTLEYGSEMFHGRIENVQDAD
jgi:hypothetical protein